MIKGNFCANSKCKNYYEDNCMLTLSNEYNIRIDSDGKCMDSVYGVSDFYKIEKETKGELNEI